MLLWFISAGGQYGVALISIPSLSRASSIPLDTLRPPARLWTAQLSGWVVYRWTPTALEARLLWFARGVQRLALPIWGTTGTAVPAAKAATAQASWWVPNAKLQISISPSIFKSLV